MDHFHFAYPNKHGRLITVATATSHPKLSFGLITDINSTKNQYIVTSGPNRFSENQENTITVNDAYAVEFLNKNEPQIEKIIAENKLTEKASQGLSEYKMSGHFFPLMHETKIFEK